MTVVEIIKEYLIKNEFDGIYNPDGECACDIEHLVECGEICDNCTVGYKTKCDCGEHAYHINKINGEVIG